MLSYEARRDLIRAALIVCAIIFLFAAVQAFAGTEMKCITGCFERGNRVVCIYDTVPVDGVCVTCVETTEVHCEPRMKTLDPDW